MSTSLTDLLSAAKRSEAVSVLGSTVECRSLTVGAIGDLIWRFPEVRKIFTDKQLDPAELVAFAPRAIGAAIAAGTGHAGDEAQEAAAAQLPIDVQIDLLGAILRLSAPGGIVPLVEKLTALMGVSTTGAFGKVPGTTSPPAPKS